MFRSSIACILKLISIAFLSCVIGDLYFFRGVVEIKVYPCSDAVKHRTMHAYCALQARSNVGFSSTQSSSLKTLHYRSIDAFFRRMR